MSIPVSRFIRFFMRIFLFVLVTIPLISLARSLQGEIPLASTAATVLLIAGFGYLEAIVIVLVERMFRTIP